MADAAHMLASIRQNILSFLTRIPSDDATASQSDSAAILPDMQIPATVQVIINTNGIIIRSVRTPDRLPTEKELYMLITSLSRIDKNDIAA